MINQPTFKSQSHETPSREGYKTTKVPQSFHRSWIKTTSASMVIITLALTAHICHGEKLSAQRCTTLKSATNTNYSKPYSKHVALHFPLFTMVDIKTAHCWLHPHTHTQTSTFENQPAAQRGPTSSDGLRIQNWILKRWANLHTGQELLRRASLLKIRSSQGV
jgi:hypothetical protein